MENNKMIPKVFEGEVFTPYRKVGFLSEEGKNRMAFQEWMESMTVSRAAQRTMKDEGKEQEREREIARLEYRQWYLSRSRPNEAINELDWMLRGSLPSELLAVSIEFVAGKKRFGDIVPKGLTHEVLRQHSVSDRISLQTMVMSSLYHEKEDGHVGLEEAREKARIITWLFGLSDGSLSESGSEWSLKYFEDTLREYNGIYPPHYDSRYQGTPEVQIIRERLENRPVTIPDRLRTWLGKPSEFLRDFRIKSDLPYFFSQDVIDKGIGTYVSLDDE